MEEKFWTGKFAWFFFGVTVLSCVGTFVCCLYCVCPVLRYLIAKRRNQISIEGNDSPRTESYRMDSVDSSQQPNYYTAEEDTSNENEEIYSQAVRKGRFYHIYTGQ